MTWWCPDRLETRKMKILYFFGRFLQIFVRNRQQPSPLLYSIDIWPARNSRLTQRETNHYLTRCANVLAWSYLAGRLPEQLVTYLLALHQQFAVCCPCNMHRGKGFEVSKLELKFRGTQMPTKNENNWVLAETKLSNESYNVKNLSPNITILISSYCIGWISHFLVDRYLTNCSYFPVF